MAISSSARFHDLEPRTASPAAGWFWVRATLCAALAVGAFVWPVSALVAFTLVFAAFSFADGIFFLVHAVSAREHRGWLVARGLLGAAVGVLFLLWPALTTAAYALTVVALIAAWALVTGVMELAALVFVKGRERWLFGIGGVLGIALGGALLLLLFANPRETMILAAWLIGSYALLAALLLAAAALQSGRSRIPA